MRVSILVLALLAGAVRAAEPVLLVKVGGYHLKTERYGAAAVADGNYVYVIAGGNRSGLVSDIERFDPRTHQSEVVTSKVKPRRYHGAAFIDGKIYIVGGQSADAFNSNVNDVDFGGLSDSTARSGGVLKSITTTRSHEAAEDYLTTSMAETSFEPTLEIFDIATGRISFGAPPLTPRISAAVAALGGRLFLIGGVRLAGRAAAQTNLTEVYDAAGNRWSPGAVMPTPRAANAVVVGDFVIVPGGQLHGASVANVEFYIPAQNSWMTLPALAQPMGAGSAAFLGNHIFLFGTFGSESQVLAYDLRTRTSRVIKPDFKPARHTAAVVLSDRIYVVGGNVNPEGDALTDIQVFALTEAK